MEAGRIEIHKDIIAEKIDELSDLSECWKRHRMAGRTPNSIRAAILMLIHEIKVFQELLIIKNQHNPSLDQTDKSED